MRKYCYGKKEHKRGRGKGEVGSKIIDQKTLLIAGECRAWLEGEKKGEKAEENFSYSASFYHPRGAGIGEKFSGDLLALHEMHIVIKFSRVDE